MGLFDFLGFIKDLISNFGYFGIFLGNFLEGVFPPIPSEVIMGFAGFLISTGRFQWIPTIIAGVLGNFLSVSLIWYVGRRYGPQALLKWGKWIGVSEKEFDQGVKLFAKYGYLMVFLCQIVPLARTLIAIPAGTMKTVYWKFILANSTGATIWLSFLAYVGFTLGENFEKITDLLKPFERAIFIVFIVFLVYLSYKFYRHIQSVAKQNAN